MYGTLANRDEIKRNTGEDPDIERIKTALDDTISDLGSYFNQCQINDDTVNCRWAGQNLRTGRKHGSANMPADPWEGSSDIRPFTVHQIIEENKELLVKSLLRGNLTAVPVEGNDVERSQMISQFMKWQLSQAEDIDRQANILAAYQEEKGIGIMGVYWDTRVEEVMQSVTVEQLANINPENPNEGQEILALIIDPQTTNEATDIIQRIFPNVNRRKARKMVNELRKTGATSIGVPEVISSKPCLKAYAIDQDIFFPANIINIQDSPYVFHVEYMTPEMVRSKVVSDGWDEEWVNTAIDTVVGKSSLNVKNSKFGNNSYTNYSSNSSSMRMDYNSGFITVVHCYEKATTEDGVPGVFITTFHPDVEGWAKSYLLDYKPARYPFVAFPREYRNSRLMDTRGVPEIAKGLQDEIKVQQDSRVDRTHLVTCPPIEYPLGRTPPEWGPAAKIGVRRRGEYGYIETPAGNINDSVEIENTVRNNLHRMFGRQVPGEDPQYAINVLQGMVDRWLRNWKKVMDQMWNLHQQFGNDVEFFRVIGSNNAEAMQFVRSEEEERVDFYLDYSIINSDATSHLEKLKIMGEAAQQHDRSGAFDFDEYLRLIAGSIDSSYSDRLIKPLQQVTEEEIRKTQDDLAKIASGQTVNAPMNANVQLRLQEVQKYIQGTEDIPATDVQQRLQSDQFFQARIDKYVKQLQFQEKQRKNAVTGRLGAEAGNSLPSQ